MEKKCRTCFAMVDRSLPRCPKCGAHQTWRRHVTLHNGVILLAGFAMVALVAVAFQFVNAAAKHGSALNCTTSISTSGMIRAHVTISNTGDRPCMITLLTVEHKDESGKVYTAHLSQDDAHDMAVPAGGMLNKTVELMPCPGSSELVAVHLFIRHFDGRTEKMDSPGGFGASCSGARAHQ